MSTSKVHVHQNLYIVFLSSTYVQSFAKDFSSLLALLEYRMWVAFPTLLLVTGFASMCHHFHYRLIPDVDHPLCLNRLNSILLCCQSK